MNGSNVTTKPEIAIAAGLAAAGLTLLSTALAIPSGAGEISSTAPAPQIALDPALGATVLSTTDTIPAACLKDLSCPPDPSASGARLKVLQEARKLLEAARGRIGKDVADNSVDREQKLYFPRQCTGFVIDAHLNAGVYRTDWLVHYDYNSDVKKEYRHAPGHYYTYTAPDEKARTADSRLNGAWRPNLSVSYLRGGPDCAAKTGPLNTRWPDLKVIDGCVHPFMIKITDAALVKPGDLWITGSHVGIVYDAQRRIIIHNAISSGPTMSSYGDADKVYGPAGYDGKGAYFLRHKDLP